MRILLSTTSYQDTPGPHHDLLASAGFDIIRVRGPIDEAGMLKLIDEHGGFDGLLNGDDDLNATVIDAALNAPTPLRVIAKYGIGLDSIDVDHATKCNLPVLFTPGVNHTTVAEHTLGLMLACARHFLPHVDSVRQGGWKRITGIDLGGKTLGIVGVGRIGHELAKRAHAFGMGLIGYNRSWDDAFAAEVGMTRADTVDELLQAADIVSLHVPLTEQTRGMIGQSQLERMKDGAMLVNTSRGALVDEAAVAQACKSGKLFGYAADVLAEEPPTHGYPFAGINNIIVTPHVGSRTLESVQRQAMRATKNLVNFLKGNADYLQANEW